MLPARDRQEHVVLVFDYPRVIYFRERATALRNLARERRDAAEQWQIDLIAAFYEELVWLIAARSQQ